jgi:hypothetical protein
MKKTLTQLPTNIIHAGGRFSDARRQRETARRAAYRAEIEGLARRVPQEARNMILTAVFTAAKENSPDALAASPAR